MQELIFANFFFTHFAGIDFPELGFNKDFMGIDFRELSLTKDFAGINFCESALYKHFSGVNFAFSLRNIFSTTLVYDFENIFSKYKDFFTKVVVVVYIFLYFCLYLQKSIKKIKKREEVEPQDRS